MPCPTQLPSWRVLQSLAAIAHTQRVAQLFEADSQRYARFSHRWQSLLVDFSKQRITPEVMNALLSLAQEAGLSEWKSALRAGQPVNHTEHRAVLHMALRNQTGQPFEAQGTDVTAEVASELSRMERIVSAIRQGDWRGYTGKRITQVVSIGIGGSHLGPQMVCEALNHLAEGELAVHFVSNVDAAQLTQTLARLNPETTLFVVSSKTFTTRETLLNANTARRWLLASGAPESAIAQHFAAVSSATDKAKAFGIGADNIFAMWDWVGGRFSLWSAIGLPIALYLGFEQFEQLLDGAHSMDEHFLTAPDDENLPVLMALIGVWNATFLRIPTQALLPYDQGLKYLPAYLQQAEMESNGKSVQRDGSPVTYPTCPIVWGQLGIDGQHAFYQLLHQGTHGVAADMIGTLRAQHQEPEHHENLLANLIAQSQALMSGVGDAAVRASLRDKGLPEAEINHLAPHKLHEGNRSSTTILLDEMTPFNLGALIALYEHKIFVQGVIWNINSYDQWGVELGKVLAADVERQLMGEASPEGQDASTAGLVAEFRQAARANNGGGL
ncbi:glucose-6-phosphate isomerase [Simiduia sp. 21SJ11W-1]|uniref:glucose-6-phosphate isomerase n=1 Tax=Simiduia sp. 21SJ11W-1 TaxID=2909669 RepID=UPI0020A1C6EA|nr:glucose-6-phosphate isomerase [Simiduia sp. 21SJ11W-1]UTA49205.1 glucose-6-phosphate isomerase [Simiduia sp. 21SJ11W-1]